MGGGIKPTFRMKDGLSQLLSGRFQVEKDVQVDSENAGAAKYEKEWEATG